MGGQAGESGPFIIYIGLGRPPDTRQTIKIH